MGLWTRATLNRYIAIGGGDDEEDADEYSERVEKKYINSAKIIEIAEKHGVYLTTEIVSDGDQVLFMIHNKGSEVRDHFYGGELWNVPNVKDDETFFQRSEDFLKDFLIEFTELSDLEFSPVGKRFIAVS